MASPQNPFGSILDRSAVIGRPERFDTGLVGDKGCALLRLFLAEPFDLSENARFGPERGIEIRPHMPSHSCLDQCQNGGREKKHDRNRRDEKFRPEVRKTVQHNERRVRE